MKVIDKIEKCEKDLTTAELIDLIANHNRQVDLVFAANSLMIPSISGCGMQ